MSSEVSRSELRVGIAPDLSNLPLAPAVQVEDRWGGGVKLENLWGVIVLAAMKVSPRIFVCVIIRASLRFKKKSEIRDIPLFCWVFSSRSEVLVIISQPLGGEG